MCNQIGRCLLAGGAFALLAIGAGGCGEKSEAATPGQSAVARGAYLVQAIGCSDCHSPHDQAGQLIPGLELTGHPVGAPLPEWDESMMSRGVLVTISPTFTAFAGPFGVSVAPNLTPDPATGIGNLTADGLIRSWREGTHWQTGQPIKPPMPWPFYRNLSDDDIRAIHAYLMSLPAKTPAPLEG